MKKDIASAVILSAKTEDFYADYSYRTILVDSDVDLTCLAPEFSINTEGINLYASEGDSESVLQVSKKSLHDFSKGPVHYTASSESKKHSGIIGFRW